jgi:hypothetical protein
MSERAPDITVEADGRAESTAILVSEGHATPTQPLFTPDDRLLYPPGPFALLMSVLRQLTGETRLTLAAGPYPDPYPGGLGLAWPRSRPTMEASLTIYVLVSPNTH